jgi:hypothetical protein
MIKELHVTEKNQNETIEIRNPFDEDFPVRWGGVTFRGRHALKANKTNTYPRFIAARTVKKIVDKMILDGIKPAVGAKHLRNKFIREQFEREVVITRDAEQEEGSLSEEERVMKEEADKAKAQAQEEEGEVDEAKALGELPFHTLKDTAKKLGFDLKPTTKKKELIDFILSSSHFGKKEEESK